MKCPLMFVGDLSSGAAYPDDVANCLKEECAWWNKFHEECAITMIALETNYLEKDLRDISKVLSKEVSN
jgi:hypothetical protein